MQRSCGIFFFFVGDIFYIFCTPLTKPFRSIFFFNLVYLLGYVTMQIIINDHHSVPKEVNRDKNGKFMIF